MTCFSAEAFDNADRLAFEGSAFEEITRRRRLIQNRDKWHEQMFCALCGRVGTRGFQLRFGDGESPQTGDWRCSNRLACGRREEAGASNGPR